MNVDDIRGKAWPGLYGNLKNSTGRIFEGLVAKGGSRGVLN